MKTKYYCDIYKLEHNNLSSLLKLAGIGPRSFNNMMIKKSMNGDFRRPADNWHYMKVYLNNVFRQKRIGARVI